MKLNKILFVYVVILAAIILFKFILWINTDYPIGRLSIVYLLSLIAVLSWRNKVTYVFLGVLTIIPFVWRSLEHLASGATPLEYTYVFYRYFIDDQPTIASIFRGFPYYFGILLFLTILLKSIRVSYGISKPALS